MTDEKDRFGEKMRLVGREREDIYFASRERELIARWKARLIKVERPGSKIHKLVCPKCGGELESYSLLEILVDRCGSCNGIWLDNGELQAALGKVSRAPWSSVIEHFLGREGTHQMEEQPDAPPRERLTGSEKGATIRTIMMEAPVTVGPDDTLDLANDMMSLGRIRHLPVLNGEKLVGMLSQGDIFQSTVATAMGYGHEAGKALLKTVRVREMMRSPVIGASPDATLREAAILMADRKIGCLPVVVGEKLVGLVTQTDILRYVVNL